MNTVLIIVAVLAFVILCVKRFRDGVRIKPQVIKSPRLGFLSLNGASASNTVADDRSAVSGLFSDVIESESTPPKCDVLFVYCDFADDGRVLGTESRLRDIIRESGAYVVVVASENSGERCAAACKPTGYGHANLVLTLERRGNAFASFYRQLFEEMAKGVSMPVAWVTLAPQVPGRDDPNCPTGYFVCEIGHIAFGYPLGGEV